MRNNPLGIPLKRDERQTVAFVIGTEKGAQTRETERIGLQA